MIAAYDSTFGLVTRTIFATIQGSIFICTLFFSLSILKRLKVITPL